MAIQPNEAVNILIFRYLYKLHGPRKSNFRFQDMYGHAYVERRLYDPS